VEYRISWDGCGDIDQTVATGSYAGEVGEEYVIVTS
jgi:hypothetical protein